MIVYKQYILEVSLAFENFGIFVLQVDLQNAIYIHQSLGEDLTLKWVANDSIVEF